METHQKPFLPISQIISMNVGFLGIQYSFGLQQTAINPLYSFLGANPEELPLLNLAGPMTGLIIQPIIGAISDKTWIPKLGRRKPFFLIGAIFCSLCLFIFPFSSSLWMAAGLLWILDAANNTTMEPYRAFIADKLNPKQQATGFLIQSFFTGCGITLANFSLYFFQKTITGNTSSLDNKSIPYWVFGSFFIGAIISITTVLFSMYKTQEIPPTDEELKLLKAEKLNIFTPFKDIADSISKMPKIMWHLFFVYLFQWYALFCYWQYISLDVSSTIFANANSDKAVYEQAVGWTGIMNGFYNLITMVAAYFLIKLTLKYKPVYIHAICLVMAGVSLVLLPLIHEKSLSLLPMVGLGIAWASIMAVPYLIVVPYLPKEKYGIYMGIINMMIVIPMLIQTISFKYIYNNLLDRQATLAIAFAGILLLIAAAITFSMRAYKEKEGQV